MTIVRIYTPGVQTLCVESSLVDNTVLVYVGKTLCASQLSISYIPHALVHFSTFLSLLFILFFFSVFRLIYQNWFHTFKVEEQEQRFGHSTVTCKHEMLANK